MSQEQIFTASDGKTFSSREEYRRYEMELRYTIKEVSDASIVRQDGDIEGQPFDIMDIKNSTIVLMDHMDQVQIDNVDNCKILIGASSESVFVREAKDCIFTIACKQLRTRDCINCTFHLYSKTEPVIELSNGLIFKPFNVVYPKLVNHFASANLDVNCNQWSEIFDFNDESKTGMNYSVQNVLESPHDKDFQMWYPDSSSKEDDMEPIVPITKPGNGAKDNDENGGKEEIKDSSFHSIESMKKG